MKTMMKVWAFLRMVLTFVGTSWFTRQSSPPEQPPAVATSTNRWKENTITVTVGSRSYSCVYVDGPEGAGEFDEGFMGNVARAGLHYSHDEEKLLRRGLTALCPHPKDNRRGAREYMVTAWLRAVASGRAGDPAPWTELVRHVAHLVADESARKRAQWLYPREYRNGR
jgi:hypothetical protein